MEITPTLQRAAEAAIHINKLYGESNLAYWPLFFDHHRYLVLKGGAGSGKSIFAGRKVLERCTTEAGHRILVCRKVARTLRESCFAQLRGQIAESYPDAGAQVNKGDLSISFANGSEVIMAGLDDVEKLKSIYDITAIWIEEASELQEQDFNQLDIRLRGETPYYKQIILSFNPISATHWLKRRFFDKPDDRVRVHESTYKDNRFIDVEAVRTLEEFKGADDYYYQVYALGQWGITGRTVFDARLLTERIATAPSPIATGGMAFEYDGLTISKVRFEDDRQGDIQVFARPEQGVPYVIGADTAGEGSDSFVAQVLDNRSGEQVAILRMVCDEDVFAHQLVALAMWYNNALVGVETNFSTYTVRELERLKYPRQYVRETMDNYTHKPRQSYGFVTNAKTRPVIIAEFVKAFRDNSAIVSDKTTLDEMTTFVRNEDYRPEAEDGAHDDCVMAMAIALHIRPQQDYVAAVTVEKVKWTEDMWEDYKAASDKERAYLIKKWGVPDR